jgi:hypothetical protein
MNSEHSTVYYSTCSAETLILIAEYSDISWIHITHTGLQTDTQTAHDTVTADIDIHTHINTHSHTHMNNTTNTILVQTTQA